MDDSKRIPSIRDETAYRHLVFTIQAELGTRAAAIFQRLFEIARGKKRCDVVLESGDVHFSVLVGSDFVFAFEFEAEISTIMIMVSNIKLVTDELQPVKAISLCSVEAVVTLPENAITDDQIAQVDVGNYLHHVSNGCTLEDFIRKTYRPKSDSELYRLAARYLLVIASS